VRNNFAKPFDRLSRSDFTNVRDSSYARSTGRFQAFMVSHFKNPLKLPYTAHPYSRRKVGLPERLSLFADRSSGPEGLQYAEEFVSPAAEKTLIGHIAGLPLQPFQFG
jgi:hypothetical protein